MTIEELNALVQDEMETGLGWKVDNTLHRLAPEILALVDAANPNNYGNEGVWHTELLDALDAFNAKLAEL